ncbi:MAG: response regulator [Parcubacteria group bacterium]
MKKILLIEDDKDQVNLYKARFELEGYAFLSASNGPDGLKLAETGKPDIILIDLLMQGMDGIEVLGHLKDAPKTKGIPAVMVTNLDKHDLAKKAMDLGARDFIVKSSVSLRDMIARVEHVLQQ